MRQYVQSTLSPLHRPGFNSNTFSLTQFSSKTLVPGVNFFKSTNGVLNKKRLIFKTNSCLLQIHTSISIEFLSLFFEL